MPKLNKINLYEEIIEVPEQELSKALSSNKDFGITIKGELRYAPFDPFDIFIYQRSNPPSASTALSISKPENRQELLGKNYQIVEKNDKVLIKAAKAWEDIINYNISNCHFDDTSGNGIDTFGDQKIEDMAWMIIEFDITYTEILKFLQENTDITLLCIERNEPYQFSAMGYFDDLTQAQKLFYGFCQKTVKNKLANDPDFTYDYLDSDQQESVEFFKAK